MDSCEEYIDMAVGLQNNDMLFTWSGGFLKPNWIGESRHLIEGDGLQYKVVKDCC